MDDDIIELMAIVKARFIEAAHTDMRLPNERTRPSNKTGFWPALTLSTQDWIETQNMWGEMREERIADDFAARFNRRPPSAAAIRVRLASVWSSNVPLA